MNILFVLFAVALFCSSCAHTPEAPPDTKADSALGLAQEDQRDDAEQSLQDLRDSQREDQKRRMERLINDPLADNRPTH